MSEPALFERLFRWDAWANERVVGVLRACGASAPGSGARKATDRLAHLLCAQEVWLSRLGLGEWPEGRTIFPESSSVEGLARDAALLAARWAQVCRVLDARLLDEVISYTSTSGAPYDTARRDILLHVTHHGAYHRGQIAVDLKRDGVICPPTDYVAFARTASM